MSQRLFMARLILSIGGPAVVDEIDLISAFCTLSSLMHKRRYRIQLELSELLQTTRGYHFDADVIYLDSDNHAKL
ncbi:hypothetical protein M378DRAFT_736693 [Amanita muscaria Koide BX008]|uniref:Uncharacterized protein n=1 Tax=Amanita muscaria (strain Koide BX008) TaxID=946122 RepID=A0A0C2X2T5_AMAMK|nr:hypothetical protein M378DRAFT_736693 [Amanita muscaria Koide BX008]